MQLIGLTGGIASGKSTVSSRLAELGAVIIDADVLAREVVDVGSPALKEIARTFGSGVIAPDGSLDRAALGAIVFADPEARSRLGEITHPAVWTRAKELISEAEEADPEAIVVYDVPLLAEGAGRRPMEFDLVVVVEAPEPVRIQRMIDDRGMTRADAVARIRAQATDEQRRALADVVIDNSGTLAETDAQVVALWDRLRGRAPGDVSE